MKKVLMLSPFYPPFPRPGATKRTEHFVRHLPENGWLPLVLTMDWGPGTPFGPERIFPARNMAKASWQAYQMADLDGPARAGSRGVRRLISVLRAVKTWTLLPDELVLWAAFAVPAARSIIRSELPDVLYATAPPNSSLLTAVLLKRLFRLPLVCDIRDDWCDNPLMEKKSGLLRLIERRMERWVVRHADRVVLVTEASLRRWQDRYPEERSRFRYIPNGYSEAEYAAAPPHPFPDRALVHIGSLEANRSPELVFRALARIGVQEPPVRFYQYGIALRGYRDLARRLGIEDRVRFEGTIPGRDTLSMIKGASLLALLPTQNAPTAIPGKSYEYLRAGKPVLLISRKNATTDFLERYPRVHRVDPDDLDGCLAVIRQALTAPGPPESATPDVLRFDRGNLARELGTLLDSLPGASAKQGSAG